jgi:hypothetical protein
MHLRDDDLSDASRMSNPEVAVELKQVNGRLEAMKKDWDAEKHRLLSEKAVLQDAALHLNVQISEAKAEAERMTEICTADHDARTELQAVGLLLVRMTL